MQYVRDYIEELYRIVAVVSLPQTAFAANGAGVKSSVLFLRKHNKKTTEKISNQKLQLKEKLKRESKFIITLEKLEKDKKQAIKDLGGKAKLKNLKLIDAGIKEEKEKLQAEFTNKINLLKEELNEKYFSEKQKILDDYPIFMAIAENIGYDATGRQTGNNELIEIAQELGRFISSIEE